jgi:hypothetical protein
MRQRVAGIPIKLQMSEHNIFAHSRSKRPPRAPSRLTLLVGQYAPLNPLR